MKDYTTIDQEFDEKFDKMTFAAINMDGTEPDREKVKAFLHQVHDEAVQTGMEMAVERIRNHCDDLKVECEEPTGVIPDSSEIAADQARNFTLQQITQFLDQLLNNKQDGKSKSKNN